MTPLFAAVVVFANVLQVVIYMSFSSQNTPNKPWPCLSLAAYKGSLCNGIGIYHGHLFWLP
jgi:hypothetical protein